MNTQHWIGAILTLGGSCGMFVGILHLPSTVNAAKAGDQQKFSRLWLRSGKICAISVIVCVGGLFLVWGSK